MPVPGAISSLSETASSNSPAGSENVGTNANDYLQAAYAFIAQLYHGKWAPSQDVPVGGFKITGAADGVAATDVSTVGQMQKYLGAPSGTRLVFQQAAAPTGWTVDASSFLQDCSMRFNAGAGHGGSTSWSGWNFGGTFAVNNTTLTVAQMPAHSHGDFGHVHGVSDPGHNHGVNDPGHVHGPQIPAIGSGYPRGFTAGGADIAGYPGSTNASLTGIWLNAAATGIGVQTGYSNLANTGGGGAHNHTYTTPQVKYADCIVCVKS